MATNVFAALDELSGESGPWMETFANPTAYTGTVFTAGSGKAVVDGPVRSEEDDAEDQRRQRREITAEVSVEAIVSEPVNKTIVFGGVTYIVRECVRSDSGMQAFRCVEGRVMEAGRRAPSI